MSGVTEQLIQDAICDEKRLERLLHLVGKPWSFTSQGEGLRDVVNQEFSLGSGRIDVLGTFNGRQKIAVVEVKAGNAGPEALSQLRTYIDALQSLQGSNPEFPPHIEIVGILIAEGFLGMTRNDLPSNVFLIRFDLTENGFPFRREALDERSGHHEAVVTERATGKLSRFCRLEEDHVSWIPESLRECFRQITDCFLDRQDQRHAWVRVNPKGEHVAVHYKGEYLVALWARKGRFDASLLDENGSRLQLQITPGTVVEDMEKIRRALTRQCECIDNEYRDAIRDFRWSD